MHPPTIHRPRTLHTFLLRLHEPRNGSVRLRLALVVALALLALGPQLAAPVAVHAAPTFTVNYFADVIDQTPGDGSCEIATGTRICTLRAALMEANRSNGATIFVPPGLYTLTIPPGSPNAGFNNDTVGDLNIYTSMQIIGAGSGSTIIDGNSTDRVLSSQYDTATLRLENLTIQHGVPSSLYASSLSGGGGIAVNGTLIGDHLQVAASTANAGGGIYAGTLLLSDSLIMSNTATAVGSEDKIGGGGIYAFSATLFNTTVGSNTTNYEGGGLKVEHLLKMTNSTVSSNSTITTGGGIYMGGNRFADPQATFANVTIAENSADSDHNGTGTGGGIVLEAGHLASNATFVNSILANNYETAYNADIHHYVPVFGDCTGNITLDQYSLMRAYNASRCVVTPPQIHFGDPLLGPLQYNGGETPTQSLLAGSPAINAGNPAGCTDASGAPLSRDQRGATRPAPAGTRCDIGAFEQSGLLPWQYLAAVIKAWTAGW